MKVLVTGGAGFIGRYTVAGLIEQGYRVVVDKAAIAGPQSMDELVTFYQLDIVSASLEAIFAEERPDCVIHLAVQVSVRRSLQNPSGDAENNIMGTINLLQQCVRYQVKKLVFASSAAVYGNPLQTPVEETHEKEPLSFYGVSKLVSEMYIIIRFFVMPMCMESGNPGPGRKGFSRHLWSALWSDCLLEEVNGVN